MPLLLRALGTCAPHLARVRALLVPLTCVWVPDRVLVALHWSVAALLCKMLAAVLSSAVAKAKSVAWCRCREVLASLLLLARTWALMAQPQRLFQAAMSGLRVAAAH